MAEEKEKTTPETKTEKEINFDDLDGKYIDLYKKARQELLAEKVITEDFIDLREIVDAYKKGAKTSEEIKNYIKNKEREFTRKAAEVTLARVKDWKEIWAETEQKGEKNFIQKTKELWKEFVVHGMVGRDKKTGEKTILNFTDLDGKASLALLREAGMDTRGVKYVAPGESISGCINLDTGDRYGLIVEEEGKTAFLDHHTDEAGRESSATKITYETLLKTGLLKRAEHLDKLVEFATQMDNNNFPEAKKYYRDSWQMMLGLSYFVQPHKLIEFFKDGRNPTEKLSPEDLKNYGLIYTSKGKEIDRSAQQKENIEKSWQELAKMEKEGFLIPSGRYGKIAVDLGNKVRGGAIAAEAYGCESYIIWDPKAESFFISTTGKITDEFSQGKKVRDSMWIKPRLDDVPLTLSLEEILEKMTDGKFKPTPEMRQKLGKAKKEKREEEPSKTPAEQELEAPPKKEEPKKKKEKPAKIPAEKPKEKPKEKAEEKKEEKKEVLDLNQLAGGLANKRKEYLEAKRQRGKLAGRGKFKGEEGEKELAKIGKEYDEARTAYIREKAKAELKDKEMPPEELNKAIVEKLLDKYNQEDQEVEKIIESREKGRWQKTCQWWRRHPKSRMITGFALSGASIGSVVTGQLWLTPVLIGARAGFSGFSTAIGTEGLLARYSKALGERGMVSKFAKISPEQKRNLKGIKDKNAREARKQALLEQNAREKIAQMSHEEFAKTIAPELDRLRTLRERKGVKLEKVGPYAGIMAAFRSREQEIMKEEALAKMKEGEKNKDTLIAQALSESLAREARFMDEQIEAGGDRERKKAAKRWIYSGLLGAAVAGLTAFYGLHRWKELKGRPGLPKEGVPVPEVPAENFEITAIRGDSVWKMARRALEGSKQYGTEFKSLNEAQKTYVIDAVKDKVAANPAKFGLVDVDQVKIGQEIDLGEILNKKETLAGFFRGARGLTSDQMENILRNNAIIREFHSSHPRVPMTSENINEILRGRGDELLGKEDIIQKTPPLEKTPEIPDTSEVTHKTPSLGQAPEPELKPQAKIPQEEVSPLPEQPQPTKPPILETAPTLKADIASRLAEIQSAEYPRSKLIKDFLEITKDNPKTEPMRKICQSFQDIDKDTFAVKPDESNLIRNYAMDRVKELGTELDPDQKMEKAVLEKISEMVTSREGE